MSKRIPYSSKSIPESTITEEVWLSEERLSISSQVLGNIYDHPKVDEGYNDDNVYTQPYRHITNWFLAKPGCESNTRNTLPSNPKKFNQTNLYGELEPNAEEEEQLRMKVVVSNIKYWLLDRHREDRGIWVFSEQAWYRLKQPCKKIIRRSNGTEISQEDLHHGFHAKIGLLSNIIDMMSDSRGFIQPALVIFHSRLNPHDSYNSLLATQTDMVKMPFINREPFDLQLLELEPAFVRNNLENLDTNLSLKCKFMKSLFSLERKAERSKSRSKMKQRKEFDHMHSAKIAADRSNRWPWGEQKEDENGVWKNKMAELSNLKLRLSFDTRIPANDVNIIIKNESSLTPLKSPHLIPELRKKGEKNTRTKNENKQAVLKRLQSSLDSSNITPKVEIEHNDDKANIRCCSPSEMKAPRIDIEKNLEIYNDPENGSVKDSMIVTFIKHEIYSDTIPEPATMLICINKLLISSIDTKKKLFDTNNTGESGVRGIFIVWLDALLKNITNWSADEKVKMVERLECKVGIAILKLLVSFTFIRKKSQLSKIEEIFDVNLCQCVDKIQKVLLLSRNESLADMCTSANSFLDSIMKNTLKKVKKCKKKTHSQVQAKNVKRYGSMVAEIKNQPHTIDKSLSISVTTGEEKNYGKEPFVVTKHDREGSLGPNYGTNKRKNSHEHFMKESLTPNLKKNKTNTLLSSKTDIAMVGKHANMNHEQKKDKIIVQKFDQKLTGTSSLLEDSPSISSKSTDQNQGEMRGNPSFHSSYIIQQHGSNLSNVSVDYNSASIVNKPPISQNTENRWESNLRRNDDNALRVQEAFLPTGLPKSNYNFGASGIPPLQIGNSLDKGLSSQHTYVANANFYSPHMQIYTRENSVFPSSIDLTNASYPSISSSNNGQVIGQYSDAEQLSEFEESCNEYNEDEYVDVKC